jgi:general secretion pathway protein B
MSLILDALKKLDREKSSRRNGTANIAAEILKPSISRPGKRILRYFTTISLTAITAAAITYAVMGGFGFLSKSSSSLPENPPVSSRKELPALPFREPVHESRDEMSRVPPKIQGHADPQKLATPLREEKAHRNTIHEETYIPASSTQKPVAHAPGRSGANAPPLKLSGIIWHEEPSERRAFIDDISVAEGSVVKGVKIVEIHPTRVRCSYNGQSFEMSMGQ